MGPPAQPARQVRVSRALGYGFVLSIAGLGGLGSLAAIAVGLWARHVIRASGGEVVGMRMAWWCIVAGSLGAAFHLAGWLQFAGRMLGGR